MNLSRLSGILLHPTSLPGPYGSGDLGKSAYHFADWLHTGSQSIWQMLPLVDVGVGNSPYMSPSAFAGNVLMIDLEQLHQKGWLTREEFLPRRGFIDHRVDYADVTAYRLNRLRSAARRFYSVTESRLQAPFREFCEKEADWLNDYALFKTLDSQYEGLEQGWQNWPEELAAHDEAALEKVQTHYQEDIHFWKFSQWCFFEQWNRLKAYANSKGILMMGDVPIFISLNSADAWSHRYLFKLNQQGRPSVVAGVPPDKFSETGQRWGNPLYNWDVNAADNYGWWQKRLRRMMQLFDIIRIDHFRGFEAYWEIPADSPTAVNGQWVKGPGSHFFSTLKQSLGELNFIAEDLGVITSHVTAIRKQFAMPGMAILQFAFDLRSGNPYLPHNLSPDTVVYTGTHDNNTTVGWWAELNEADRDQARRYLSVSGEWIHWDLIRAAWSSVGRFAIAPMQDVLGLDGSHRMNLPGQATGSWEWRFTWDMVEDWHATRLAELTWLYGRKTADLESKTAL